MNAKPNWRESFLRISPEPLPLSLFILFAIWFGAGLFLFLTASRVIMPQIALNPSPVIIVPAILALLVGVLKGAFILRKTAKRHIDRGHLIQKDSKQDLFLGWLKLMGVPGVLILGLMIVFGVFLGHWLESVDPLYRAYLRLAIGVALLIGSRQLFQACCQK